MFTFSLSGGRSSAMEDTKMLKHFDSKKSCKPVLFIQQYVTSLPKDHLCKSFFGYASLFSGVSTLCFCIQGINKLCLCT